MTGHDTAASPDPPRDPVLDRAYASGAREEPPAHLDAAIRAAARREVGARPRRPDSLLRGWRAPLALAAVLVLSVSVVLLMRDEGADRLDHAPSSAAPPVVASPPPPAAAPSARLEDGPAAAASRDAAPQVRGSPAPSPESIEEDRGKQQASSDLRQAAPPPAAEAPRSAPQPFAEPPAAPEGRRAVPGPPPAQTSPLAKEMEPGAAAGARERAAPVEREVQAQKAPEPRAEKAPVPPAAAPDSVAGAIARSPAKTRAAAPEDANRMEQKLRDDAAAAAPRPVWQGFERQPPEKWLERVEELRRGGRDEEAREMLAEFRKRFPQHPIPPSLDR